MPIANAPIASFVRLDLTRRSYFISFLFGSSGVIRCVHHAADRTSMATAARSGQPRRGGNATGGVSGEFLAALTPSPCAQRSRSKADSMRTATHLHAADTARV